MKNKFMKKWGALTIALFIVITTQAQDPVHWKYHLKKINAGTYEVHMNATVDAPWHVYSQVQPKDAIPLPTEIRFLKSPLISLIGKTKETGKMEKHIDKTLDSEDWRYSGTVDFVQVVQIKTKVKTNVSAKITYQVCTDEQCLPPKTVSFNLQPE